MYALRSALCVVPLALACGGEITGEAGKGETQDRTAPDAPAVEACEAQARTLSPVSDGASDFYFLDEVVFEVTNGADTARIRVESSEGALVDGSTWLDTIIEHDGWQRVVFTPDAQLQPSTSYTAGLEYCGGNVSVAFETSALGTPLDTPDGLANAAFEIDLTQARITRPGPAVQALLRFVDHDLLIQVIDVTDDTLSMRMGAQDRRSGEQDTCMPTISIDMVGSLVGAPTFALGPVDIDFSLAGYDLTLFEATASATFARDGETFAEGQLQGMLDARDVVDALAGHDVLPWEEPDALCDLVASVGMPCVACTDGAEYCVEVEVGQVAGTRVSRDIEEVATFDCHAGCADSCDNESCEAADQFPVCN